MARPRKVIIKDSEEENRYVTQEQVEEMITEAINQFKAQLDLQVQEKKHATLLKVEDFNGEQQPEQVYDSSRMTTDEMLFSVLNTVKILPPNLLVDGRHTLANVQALNGRFKVTEEMLDQVYSTYKHEG